MNKSHIAEVGDKAPAGGGKAVGCGEVDKKSFADHQFAWDNAGDLILACKQTGLDPGIDDVPVATIMTKRAVIAKTVELIFFDDDRITFRLNTGLVESAQR